jgi:dihydrofolate reductase
MRKVTYSMSVSLDGFMETKDHQIDWVIVDEELHTFFNEQARASGVFLYGRRMYELMTDYWPTADTKPGRPAFEVEYAHIWKNMPKVVFSKTLDKVEWNSRLVRGDIAEEIKNLKAQPGKDLQLGGAAIASACIQLGLVDEYGLFVNPIVLGSGTPFFPALQKPMTLRLMETRRFRSGVVYLRYENAGKGISKAR